MAILTNLPALMTFGKAFSRSGAFPLDMYEIWTNKEELITYAASDPTAYVGQKVAYVDTAAGKVIHYSIEIDGSLKELGADLLGVEDLTAADAGKIPQAFKVVDVEESGEEGAEDYQPEVSHIEIRWVEAKLTDTITTLTSADNSVTLTKNGDNYDLKVNFPEIDIPEVPEYAVRKEAKDGYHGVYHLTKDGTDVDVAIEVPVTDLSAYAKTGDLVDYTVTVSTENVEDHSVKHYVFSQCGKEIAHVDVPKDLVVESGRVEEKTEAGAWGEAGTYIVLEIANQEDPIYVNAKDLVDIYTVDDTATVDMHIDGTKITADVKISAEAGNSLVAKNDGLYVNAPKLPDSADAVVDKQYVTSVDQKDGKVTVTRKQISYNELADLPTIPGDTDFGVLDITGKEAIQVTGEQEKEIALLLDNTGNVTLSQSASGLKAEVTLPTIPNIAIADATPATPAPATDTATVIASLASEGHTITPTVIDVVTKKAWDTLDATGERLINTEEINKLSALVIGEGGSVEISGTINATNVHGLGTEVIEIVTGTGDYISTPAVGQEGEENYVPATIVSKLGIEKGAQVNTIETIGLPDAVLAISDKQVNLPAFVEGKYGVIKGATDVDGKVAKNQVYANNGVGEVKAISTDTLVNGEKTLILNGGKSDTYVTVV